MRRTKKGTVAKTRITIDLTKSFYDRLGNLEKLSQASSKADVIRNSLQIYEYFVQKTLEGYHFRAIGKNGKEEDIVFLR